MCSEPDDSPAQVCQSDASASFSPESDVSNPSQQCPLARSIRGRFGSNTVKCGSPVELQADATNIADGTRVSFRVRRHGALLATTTENGNLNSHQVRNVNWVSQRPNKRGNVEMDLRVSGGGASADGENRLQIHQYPDIAVHAQNITRPVAGFQDLHGRYDISFSEGWISIAIRIKVLNMQGGRPATGAAMPAVGPALSDREKRSIQNEIEGYLSEKWLFHRHNCRRHDGCGCRARNACCKMRVRVRVRLVESNQHVTVRLFTGSGRANVVEWFRRKSWPTSYAHETGHSLGWYDEYDGGATGPSPWHVQDGTVMASDGPSIPDYYYKDFKDWFANEENEPWDYKRP